MQVWFLHLDLGLGGAERLVVDAACSLKQRSHQVTVATSHHDPSHSFPETHKGGGVLGDEIHVAGDWIPRHACGSRFHLLFAILRMCFLAVRFRSQVRKAQVLVVDQVSFVIPILWLVAPSVPVVFYCHFPDQLLVQSKRGVLKRAYRWVFDYAEEVTTSMADCLVVNSNFTADTVRETFTRSSSKQLRVLYPCIDLKGVDKDEDDAKDSESIPFSSFPRLSRLNDGNESCLYLLSINRFERKKGLDLALRAFKKVKSKTVKLVMAGGYDNRVKENIDHLEELEDLAAELGIADRIIFVPSCTGDEKHTLLHHCELLLYTPINEHFGIVPIEAMSFGKPVIACNSGGPLETIVDSETGFLVKPEPDAFAHAIDILLLDRMRALEMGQAARRRVEESFSRDKFGLDFEQICQETISSQQTSLVARARNVKLLLHSVLAIFIAVMAISIVIMLK